MLRLTGKESAEATVYEAELSSMSLSEIIEVLAGLRNWYERGRWSFEDVELVAAIRDECIYRGYPESRVDLVCAFAYPTELSKNPGANQRGSFRSAGSPRGSVRTRGSQGSARRLKV
jgi:hypothetical protein